MKKKIQKYKKRLSSMKNQITREKLDVGEKVKAIQEDKTEENFVNLIEEREAKIEEKKAEINALIEQVNENNFTKHRFSVVTAAYNNADYIDDYFISFIKQSHSFKEYIEIIYVDDGSTDNTEEILKKWVDLYPENIKYIKQENAGQSEARNHGMQYATNKWMTFTDADDMLSPNYFHELNCAINLYPNVQLFATHVIFYLENKNIYRKGHPLSFKFKERFNYIDLKALPYHSQLSMASAVFNREIVSSFDLKIRNYRPTFEDAFFIYEYLLKINETAYVAIKQAEYHYRKRMTKNSTIDLSASHPNYFTTCLYRYRDILDIYKRKLNIVPNFVQSLVLYDLFYNIQECKKRSIELTEEILKQREAILQEIFNLIDFKNIVKYPRRYSKIEQISIHKNFYQNEVDFIPFKAYLFQVSYSYIRIRVVSEDGNWEFKVDGKLIPKEELDIRENNHDMHGRISCYDQTFKVPVEYVTQDMKVVHNGIAMRPVGRHGRRKKLREDSIVIFHDRIGKADDNAEVLYKWWQENKPEYKNIYFAISKECNDYYRLRGEGFNVVDFDSEEFEELYLKADFIISSALDGHIENYKGLRRHKQSLSSFIFLQHGITINDLSSWFNIKLIDGIVIGSTKEKSDLVKAPYLLDEEDLITSGFPRYDCFENQSKKEKMILFAPTWRKTLDALTEAEYEKTSTFKAYISLLNNERLINKLGNSGYKLIVIVHPRLMKFIKLFNRINVPNIEFKSPNEIQYYKYLGSCRAAITDWSSVVMDVAYQKKPIFYYQFDESDFVEMHSFEELMDYRKEGFGEVLTDEEALVNSIIKTIDNDFKLDEKYKKRIDEFFIRTESSCEQVFNYIFNLGRKNLNK